MEIGAAWEKAADVLNRSDFEDNPIQGATYKKKYTSIENDVKRRFAIDSTGANLSAITDTEEWEDILIQLIKEQAKWNTEIAEQSEKKKAQQKRLLAWTEEFDSIGEPDASLVAGSTDNNSSNISSITSSSDNSYKAARKERKAARLNNKQELNMREFLDDIREEVKNTFKDEPQPAVGVDPLIKLQILQEEKEILELKVKLMELQKQS